MNHHRTIDESSKLIKTAHRYPNGMKWIIGTILAFTIPILAWNFEHVVELVKLTVN